MRTFLFVTLAMASAFGQKKDGPFPAHRIADNLYYVGSVEYSSYLITSPKGHILINASFPETVPLIRASVESLGFKFNDVKILLTSHAHGDHVAGTFEVKEATAAKVLVMEGDQDIIASGGGNDFNYKSKWKPVAVDRVLKDGDKVELGGMTLVAHKTPGHTRGCTTWTMTAKDGGKSYNVVIVGSPNVNPGYKLVNNDKYPGIADDYKKAFAMWNTMKCDIFLGAHGNYYDMDAKYAKMKSQGGNPFIDPEGYRMYIASKEVEFLTKLRQQREAAK